jgi:tetratricopeptide (TPR) repeat protein
MNKVLKVYILLFMLVPAAWVLNAQPMSKKQLRKTTTKAENLFDKGEYFKSLQLWEKLLLVDSSNAYYNYHAGVCKYNIRRYRVSSLKNFLRAYNKINHDVHFYLGSVYHLTGKLDMALKEYNQYLETAKEQKTFTDSEVRRQINKVIEAQRKIAEPTRAEIFNLGSQVNTEFPEYVPLISADGKILFFTSRRAGSTGNELNTFGEYYEDIYEARFSGGKWNVAKNLSAPVNSNNHDACVGLTPEGQTLLIYRTSKSLVAGDIYASVFDGSNWTAPALLSQINSEKWLEPSACYSPDGNTIYFSSNRPGGFGGKDLYRITKLPNGQWSLPANLGPNVNTAFDEDAPFIHPDGKRLYFSSTGHDNMGGYDVYYSTADSSLNWSKALNMGYPLNTVDDDIYFVVTGDGSTGFISSDRDGGMGETDIYKVVLHENDIEYEVRSGYVKAQNGSPLEAKITLIDNTTNKVAGIFKSNHYTGKFILLLAPEREYTVLVESPEHHSESVHIQYEESDIEVILKNK